MKPAFSIYTVLMRTNSPKQPGCLHSKISAISDFSLISDFFSNHPKCFNDKVHLFGIHVPQWDHKVDTTTDNITQCWWATASMRRNIACDLICGRVRIKGSRKSPDYTQAGSLQQEEFPYVYFAKYFLHLSDRSCWELIITTTSHGTSRFVSERRFGMGCPSHLQVCYRFKKPTVFIV